MGSVNFGDSDNNPGETFYPLQRAKDRLVTQVYDRLDLVIDDATAGEILADLIPYMAIQILIVHAEQAAAEITRRGNVA